MLAFSNGRLAPAAIAVVAGLTAASGLWVAVDLGTGDSRSEAVRVDPGESAVVG
jgi:hypothetical protein